jgi:hypothetical protein
MRSANKGLKNKSSESFLFSHSLLSRHGVCFENLESLLMFRFLEL